MWRMWFVSMMVMLLLTNCREDDGKDPVYTGLYSFGFEVSSFSPCGGDERWWAGGSGLTERYLALGVPSYEEVFVRLRGTPSETGRYGHLGAYDRKFEVTEVVEIRRRRDGDCRGVSDGEESRE
jgi:hypothetical protein